MDYIFHSGLPVRRVCHMLTPAELQRNGDELPNLEWPSDHMALCADFAWPPPPPSAGPRPGLVQS